MKRKLILAIAAVVSFAYLSQVPSDSTVNAAQGMAVRSGVVTPATGQIFRTSLSTPGDGGIARIKWMRYAAVGCMGTPPVCRHEVVSQGATEPFQLDSNEAVTFDVPGNGSGLSIDVDTNSRNPIVVFQLIDMATGEVTAVYNPAAGAFY